jgi:hypothetical protein
VRRRGGNTEDKPRALLYFLVLRSQRRPENTLQFKLPREYPTALLASSNGRPDIPMTLRLQKKPRQILEEL